MAVGVGNVHLSWMLLVLNPFRIHRPRGPLATTALLVLATLAATFAGAAAQDAAGFEHLRAGRYDEAVRTLRSQARDGSAAALSGWVTALRETGDYEGAVEAAEQGVERGIEGARALLGAALMEVGRIDEARTALSAGVREPGAAGALARVELGILEYRYGDRQAARALFYGFIDFYNNARDLSAAELTAVGRALIHLSRWDFEYAHDALSALDEAVAAGSPDHAAQLAAGQLFLERYDARQAADAFQAVLAENPSHPDALLGLARVARLEGGGDAVGAIEAALATNDNLAGARTLLSRIRLLGGDRSRALEEVDRVLEVNPADLEALGTKAAILHLSGDDRGFRAVMETVRSLTSFPTSPLVVLSELHADHRKYEDALAFARQATEADPDNWTGWGLMGLNQVRLGRVDAGRENLEKAFAGDRFNLWFKNTLDLLDTFVDYRVVETPHFRFVLHKNEAELLGPYMEPVAERAWREMSARYGYAPDEPIRVEVYPRHADFSVRTVGLVGIGALGVSFGPALAMDSPAARDPGAFNWASALWHEIAHSFHIGVSNSEVPRWFSEGLSVHEQRKADPGWGHQAGISFVASLAAGELRPVSELDRGFSNPRHPGEVRDSYYQASLVFEVIEERHGFPAIVRMLHAYRDGATDEEAFERALGVDLGDFDREFEDFLKERFAAAIGSVGGESVAGTDEPPDPTAVIADLIPDIATLEAAVARDPGRFAPRMALGQALFRAGRGTEAAPHFEAAIELFPQYGGPDGAHWFLGRIREEQGDTAAAVTHYRAIVALNESHYDARVALGALLNGGGDGAGGAEVLRHLAYIHPYEIADHEHLATLMEELGDIDGAIAARRAVLALRPVDRAVAHYQIARLLHLKGDHAAARSAVLAALEIAPNYEEALDLLLELQRGGPRR